MEGGLLSLKWNNHRSTFFHILSTARTRELYSDATLACDGRFYPVHKLVLSTCSEYFEQMFERTQCKHPVIVLKDIRGDDLEALLNYMYIGEVNVLQNDLAGLIKAAECLRIKGLAVPDEAPNAKEKDYKRAASHKDSPTAKRRKSDEAGRTSGTPQSSQSRSQELSADVGRSRHSSGPPNRASSTSPGASGVDYGSPADLPSRPPQSESRSSDTSSHSINEQRIDDGHSSRDDTHQDASLAIVSGAAEVGNALVKQEPQDIEEESKEGIFLGHNPSLGATTATLEGGKNAASQQQQPPDFRPSHLQSTQHLNSQPQNVEDLMAMALPGASGMQGNSVSGWESEGGYSCYPVDSMASGDNATQGRLSRMSGLTITSPSPTHHIHSDRTLGASSATTPPTPPPTQQQQQPAPPTGVGGGGVRGHPCPFCPKTFAAPYDLGRHVRTHTGEKPFACPYCPYRSAQKSNLAAHVRIHTGEEPYVCPHCDYRSKNGGNLRNHIRKWHENLPPLTS